MREINTTFVMKGDDLKKFVDNTDYIRNGEYGLEKYFNEINSAINYIDDETNRLMESKTFLELYDIGCDSNKFIETLQCLTDKKNELFINRVEFKNLLYCKQKECEHDEDSVRYIGHDHNYEYHVCEKCGKEFKL